MSPLSGERDEVKRLETGAAEDLSAGAQDADSRILTENINDQRLQRVFRQWAFFGVGVVFLGTFSALLGWVVLIGMNIMDQSITTTYRASLFIAPFVVLASLMAVLALALLRFAFRPMNQDKDDSPSPKVLIHELLQAITDIAKDYLKTKKAD